MQSLENHHRTVPTLVTKLKDAVREVQKKNYDAVILDYQDGVSEHEVVQGMRMLDGNIKVILIPSEEYQPPHDPDLLPDATLNKPFYMPDFLELLAHLEREETYRGDANEREGPEQPGENDRLDAEQLAQHLTRLSLETAAQAAFLIRDDQLWAYAGELPRTAAEELAGEVQQSWKRNGENDLARFFHLEETNREYMIYATAFGEAAILTMAFDTDVPFSEIRAQADTLVQSLTDLPEEQPVRVEMKKGAEETEADSAHRMASAFHDVFREMELPPTGFPDGAPSHRRAGKEAPVPPVPPGPIDLDGDTPPESGEDAPYPVTTGREEEHRVKEEAQELALSHLDPITEHFHYLSYCCVLVPRFPEHKLEGGLIDDLQQWLKLLCQAFGWRLVKMDVQAAYLQWVMITPPEIAPVSFMSRIQEHTSRWVFQSYPDLINQNPSGEFWAVGKVILSGRYLLSRATIENVVQKIRAQQGR